ncbi:RDD family protein [Streptomyces sp. H10-C2]|uniref:RDD family protein n=1 Tax=unclassified Streptomyces TaxID=2593676 RepID=UPI0024B944C3|nr:MULTISPECIES: RDD family protein [unclassified Streptomyces]MDJ0344382.1 RDD family protein [Streptomyces sp. PH10-H1]MDJ0373751.1 RDD family protein [Streptomyces sp. H10-C2]
MSTDQPTPGSGDDPFAKPPDSSGPGTPGGSPYGRQPPSYPPPQDGGGNDPYSGNPYGGTPPGGGAPPPYGGGPYGGAGGEPDPLAGMPPLGDAGKRLLARIIDFILVTIPVALLDWAVGGIQTNTDNFNYSKSLLGSLVGAVLYIGYEWWMTKSTGQTLAKKWLGLRVANLENGSVPDSKAALIRASVFWLPTLFCCPCLWILLIGILLLLDKPYRQGLHDKAAKTVVVSA